jgi:BirA family biotin operon repressor/biotin-[acetyl-CoA-carboxylase] ligase
VHTLIVTALKRLGSGESISVVELARALDCAPTRLAEALRQAAVAGAPLHYEPERGYRLAAPIDWLDPSRIQAAVAGAGFDVRVVDACGSTNAQMMRAARNGAPGGQVLAAEVQWQGRGRLGRRWHSGLGSALTFSLLWRSGKPASALEGLSLAVGVAIVRALRRRAVAAELKWPNDILWQGRKLGGVLIEVHGAATGPCAVVIGIGVNVRLSTSERERIDQAAADLAEAGPGARSRSDWLAAILLELAAVLEVYARSGFPALQREWDGYHAHAGRLVELALPNGERVSGTAAGVDEAGRLLLVTGEGTRTAMSGDVSLRASA